MVIEQKALVGKLNKFPSGIQQLFALGSNFRSCQQTDGLFHPFGCIDNGSGDQNLEQIDRSDSQVSTVTDEQHGKSGSLAGPLSQTYPQWKVMCDVQKLHSLQKRKRFKNRKMYILPLGTSDEKATVDSMVNEYQQNGLPNHYSNLLDIVMKFTSLFFYGMEVKLLPFQDINNLGFTMRVHITTSRTQALVTDILGYLKKIRPNDSFCIVGWSSLDLYPCPELNFVLGEACFDTGCAVISFGHYADIAKQGAEKNFEKVQNNDLQNLNEPSCASVGTSCLSTAHHDEYPSWDCTNLDDNVIWRLIKVLTHEVCHLLGMHHCTFFACLMNESSNVSQAQNQPMFLCPICLRKLHKFLQFTIVSRYKKLKDFMEPHSTIVAGKRQLLASSGNQPYTTKCQDYSEHLDSLAAIDSPDDQTYDTYTLKKFRNSLNWLDSVLQFIG